VIAALGIAGALLAVAGLILLTEVSPATPLRHAYFVPVVLAALRFGFPGGVLAAGGAVLLHAPLVLPGIERTGLTAPVGEGLVTLATLALFGALAGARFVLLLATHRALAVVDDLVLLLGRMGAGLGRRLARTEVALVVREGEDLIVAGGESVAPGSVAASVLEAGQPVFVSDAGNGPRPRRVFATPLLAGGETIGALVVERLGELSADERGALATLAAQIGLGLENARLAWRQRRFADELATKVAQATRRLGEADRAKSAFVAIASHELRTPLTALGGFSELLAARSFSPPEVRRLAEIMRRETERLTRIVSDLLDLSRLEQGLTPALRRGPVAVEAAIAAALEVLGPGPRFEVACAPDLPRLHADPDAVDRILKNLVSNAVKYSPPASVIWLSARAAADGVEVTVEDGGCGIPADALPRVFEPFFRAPAAVGAARGAGIGLAVVKSLVEAHGGRIRVESEAGVGTRVTFALPAVP
jgi:signal transduction histidine kinase